MRISYQVIPKFTLLLFFILLGTISYAQKEEADKLVKLADEMYNFGDPKDARGVYEQALVFDPAHVKANFMVGICYLETTDKPKGLKYFLKTYELDHKYSDKILFYIAKCYHLGHDFDNAIIYYKKHRDQMEKDYKSKLISRDEFANVEKEIERKVYECLNGKEFIDNPVHVKIKDIGRKINSSYAEYTPAITSDEKLMIFTSRRAGTTGGLKANDNEYWEDIYYSEKDENGKWKKAKNIGPPINGEFHDAVMSLSPDGDELYLYKDEGNGDIYKSEKVGEEWSVPIPIKDLNTNAKENHIVANSEGNMFIFSSDRNGGYGKLDLYKVTKDSRGKWGKPENLGDVINTEMNEESPFLDLDGKTLYFSSEGHKGMGGYDIFKTVYNETTNTWSEPQNIGYPINTSDDDIYFVLSGDGKNGYYSSFKAGGRGEKDIYIIDMNPPEEEKEPEPEIKETEPVVKKTEEPEVKETPPVKKDPEPDPEPEIIYNVTLKGVVKNYDTKGPVPNAKLEIHNASTNELITTLTADNTGYYEYQFPKSNKMLYVVSAEKPGFIYKTYKVQVPKAKEYEQVVIQNFELRIPEANPQIAHILRNIYFNFDKSTIKPESIVELQKLEKMLKSNPTWKVEIAGHTDNLGSAEYNKTLSQRRSQAVVMYLIGRGVASNRLVPKGYGEEQPIASNDDEKDGREINRRTEFRILSK